MSSAIKRLKASLELKAALIDVLQLTAKMHEADLRAKDATIEKLKSHIGSLQNKIDACKNGRVL